MITDAPDLHKIVELKKLYPLQISRGTSTGSRNVFVFVTDGTHTGVVSAHQGQEMTRTWLVAQ